MLPVFPVVTFSSDSSGQRTKSSPPHAFWCTGRREGKLRLVLFVLELYTNRSNFNFPFLRPVNPNDPRGWILGTVLEGGVTIDKIVKVFLKKLGSDLGLRSSR